MSGNRDPHDPGYNGRTEPKLGDLDHLDRPRAAAEPNDGLPRMKVEPDYRRGTSSGNNKKKPKGGRGWLMPVLVVALVAVIAGLWFNQNSLRGLVPRTDFDDVLHRAQAALQQGHLDGTDGTSARELFEAARALEPDNDSARQGLNDVGRAEIARADAALQAGHLDEATQALTNARELLGGGNDVDRLSQAIAKAQVATGQTTTLVDQAQQALSAGKLDGPDGAAALYQRVLAADPDNAVARHGLDQVGDALAAQIQKALAANDVATASTSIDRLAALLPNYAQLPTLRAALASQQAQAGSALADAISQGNDALRAGRVVGEGDDTALAHFKAALAIDPNNPQAKAGLGQVAEALIVQANAAIDSGDTDQAKQLLAQATALAPNSADLVAARARLGQPVATTGANDDDDNSRAFGQFDASATSASRKHGAAGEGGCAARQYHVAAGRLCVRSLSRCAGHRWQQPSGAGWFARAFRLGATAVQSGFDRRQSRQGWQPVRCAQQSFSGRHGTASIASAAYRCMARSGRTTAG